MGEDGGAVINIGSVASVAAPAGASVYSATKGAVDVITRKLAAELGPRKILVNAVLPGPVETEGNRDMANSEQINAGFVARTPLGRLGQPEILPPLFRFCYRPRQAGSPVRSSRPRAG